MENTIDVEASEAASPRGLPKLPKMLSRNSEIGNLLKNAREYRNIPVTRCAELVGTSRRRYLAMEEGKATIGAVELEELVHFLDVPPGRVWRIAEGTEPMQNLGNAQEVQDDQYVEDEAGAPVSNAIAPGVVTLRILPGQTVTLVVDGSNYASGEKKIGIEGRRRKAERHQKEAVS